MRLKAISALGKIGPEAREAVSSLRSLLSDPNYPVRLEAAIAISRITGEFSEPASFLRPLFNREDKSGLWPNTHTFDIALESPQTIPLLIELLKDSDKYVRDRAFTALSTSKTNLAKARPQIEALLNDPSFTVRNQASNALRMTGQTDNPPKRY